MKNLFILSFLFILCGSAFAQQTPVDPPKPQEIKVIRGTFTIHASTTTALVVKCINSSDICVLKIVRKSSDNMGTGWPDQESDYELPPSASQSLNPDKNYLGLFKSSGGIHFFEVNSINISGSDDSGITIDVDAGYDLRDIIERRRE